MSMRTPMQMGQVITRPDTNTSHFPQIIDVSQGYGVASENDTYIKAFLMDESTNANFWHVPKERIEKYVKSFIGKPLIRHPTGKHPDYIKEGAIFESPDFKNQLFNIQERYKIGEIVDVNYEARKDDPSKFAWFAVARMTNPEYSQKIKSGAISHFVSPQIFDNKEGGTGSGEPTTDFTPLHLAIVDQPAYGDRALIRAVCNGRGTKCLNALKSAAVEVVNTIENLNESSSSFFRNSGIGDYKLNPNNFQQYYDPNNPDNYPPTQNQNLTQQTLNEKQQTQSIDQNGNVITQTTDKKLPAPNTGKPQQIQQQGQLQQVASPPPPPSPQPTSAQSFQQQPNVPVGIPTANPPQLSIPFASNPSQINASDPQLPNAVIEALQQKIQGLETQVQNFDKFKQTEEEKQIKQASEEQRAMIESFITPDVIADEASRTELVDWLVSLNLDDENIKKLLDLVVNGSFTATPSDPSKSKNKSDNVASASKEPLNNVSGFGRKDQTRGAVNSKGDVKLAVLKKVKGAAIMNNRPEFSSKSRRMYPNDDVSDVGILSGVDVSRLPF